jgi:hypothetical protein
LRHPVILKQVVANQVSVYPVHSRLPFIIVEHAFEATDYRASEIPAFTLDKETAKRSP